jgi:RNA polymerase sigma factor (sigma-70 family)
MDFTDRLSHEVLPGAIQIDLLRRIKHGDEDALNELIRCNQKYVASICSRYAAVSSRDVEFDDLMQAGNIGLLKAIEMWDESKNVQFSTYAYYWIRAKARRFALHKSTDLSISFHFSEKIVLARQARTRLLSKLQREPTPEEIAEFMNLPIETVTDMLRAMENSVRLDLATTGKEKEKDEVRAVVQLRDTTQDTEEEGISKAMIAKVKKCICKLTDRQQIVINHLYGLNGCQMMSSPELARKLGVSRQAVDDIARAALKHLRSHITSFEHA